MSAALVVLDTAIRQAGEVREDGRLVPAPPWRRVSCPDLPRRGAAVTRRMKRRRAVNKRVLTVRTGRIAASCLGRYHTVRTAERTVTERIERRRRRGQRRG